MLELWITQFIEAYGYLAVFLVMVLENVFPPIPSEIVLPFSGFMTTQTSLNVIGVVVTATAGSVVGAIVLYGIGKLLDVARLEQIIDGWGRVLRIQKKDVRRAGAWFDRYGAWTVFFCRMVPIVRSLISIPAGMSTMNVTLFLTLTAVGTALWNSILVSAGAALGQSWPKILDYISLYTNVVYVFIGVLAVLGVAWYIRRRKRG